jgi:hypothetical protein
MESIKGRVKSKLLKQGQRSIFWIGGELTTARTSFFLFIFQSHKKSNDGKVIDGAKAQPAATLLRGPCKTVSIKRLPRYARNSNIAST